MWTIWTRAELKAKAKAHLKPFYWYGFLVCIIAAFLGGGSSGFGVGAGARSSNRSNGRGSISGWNYAWNEETIIYFMIFMAVFLIIFVLIFALFIFVGNLVAVGKLRFFMESASMGHSAGVERLFFAFSKGNYFPVMKTMFFMGFFETMWTFLFIIPGIYKHYEYFMIPYLLAENPQMDRHEAFRLSKEMMDGHKFNTFVLELSFIGWYLLGLLLCFVGGLFVNPYYEMTFVELYWTLRDHMLGSQQPMDQSIDPSVYTDASYREV